MIQVLENPTSAKSPRTLPKVVDVHSHPMLGIGTQPPTEVPQWSVQSALDLMDQHSIAKTVLSINYPADQSEGQKACDIARQVNERLAEIVVSHPSRFIALATMPARTIDGCLNETAYALDTLKLDGITVSTSVNDLYLGDKFYDPWFEEMDRRGVTLLAHPTIAKASLPLSLGINASILEFMFDTTRMLTNMVFTGAKKRFSKIKIISTHAGGTIPYLVKRIQTLEAAYGAGKDRAPLSAEEIKEGFGSFYYDLTAGTSPDQLYGLAQLVPASKLLVGLDYPFMDPNTFGPTLADIAAWTDYSDEDLQAIANGNAAVLFPKLLSI